MPTKPPVSKRLSDLFSKSRPQKFDRRETIIRAEDAPQGVYYLASGFVKMNSLLSDGREITANILKPQTYFPMMWALSDIPNTYNFQAITPVELHRISKDKFLEFIHANPDVLLDFTNRILIGLNGLLFNINYILSGNSYKRIIAAVIMLSKRFGEPHPSGKIIINFPLTHQDLADIAAVTRETASINIKKLENAGLITQNVHRLIINDPQKLQTESEMEYAEIPPPSSL